MQARRLPLSILSVSLLTLLTACSGSGDGEDSSQLAGANALATGQTSASEEITAAATVSTGRFIDSAVAGLTYRTSTRAGVTDADGTFEYLPGEDVTFSIGSIELPPVAGAAIITPLTVFATSNISDARVADLAQLLQTLDEDANAENGINITPAAAASATGLSVEFGDTSFEDSVINLVANSGSVNTELVSAVDALTHLQETLVAEGMMEAPGASASHPLVGTSRQFTTRSHEVSGTVTVLDDRTIEITNFNYDGGGPSVFFYTGVDGDYSAGGSGRIIGEMLNGRVYENDTLRVTLPDDLTLDDFNGISVWCDEFFVSFGDVEF